MWSMVRRVSQFLGLSTEDPEIDWEEVAAVLDAEDDPDENDQEATCHIVNNKGSDNIICQHRVGIITELYDTHGYISNASKDDKEAGRPVYFQKKNAPLNIQVGDQVVYLAFRLSEDDDWIVKKILCVENELWDRNEEAEENTNVVQSAVKQECETAYKHIIAKVTGREGRNIIAGNIQFSLDSVQIDFVPVEGDWLSLDSLVQSESECDNVLMIDRVTPLRSTTKEGRVTHWNPDCQLGILGGEVLFSKEACEPGYLPVVGDQVTAFCIECEHNDLTWRAIQIVPITEREIQSSHDPQLAQLLEDKQGITISENTNFGAINISQEKQIAVEVKNNDKSARVLVAIEMKNHTQFRLMPLPSPPPVTIQPQASLIIDFKVRGRFVGRTTELVTFKFEGFDIGRQLAVDVQNASLSSSLAENRSKVSKYTRKEEITGRKLLATRSGFIVPGVRPIKPASFVSVQLGRFNIPEKLVNLVLGSDKRPRKEEVIAAVLKDYSCLSEPLSGQNYVQRWGVLLYIEELEHMANISRYNTTAALRRVDEYLSLEIPGLAEQRPSLIVGDQVIARPAWGDENSWSTDNSNSVAYEGHIHKVLSNEVLLKFDPSFHDSCYGVYSLSFQASRTLFRRMQQAVNVGFKNLSAEWLFPSKVNYQPPQVDIIGEENYIYKREEKIMTKDKDSKDDNSSRTFSNEKNINTQTQIKDCDKIVDNINYNEQLLKSDSDNNRNNEDAKFINKNFITVESTPAKNLTFSSENLKDGVSSSTKSKSVKHQKGKVSDFSEITNSEAGVSQPTSPPRVPVVERFLQNGNCHHKEKSPKEVKNVLKQLAALSLSAPKNDTEMKTLEEIERTLIKNVNNSAVDGITPLTKLTDPEKIMLEQDKDSNNILNKEKCDMKNRESFQQKSENISNMNIKEKNDKTVKNGINESKRTTKMSHERIKWNTDSEMKKGIEKEAVNRIRSWKKKKIRWFNPKLNHYQKEAVRNILKGEARPLPYVIFGPPGTGKTITVVEAILQIYFLIPESRLLIATPSNSAADLVCERLIESGLLAAGDLLRLCSHNYVEQGRIPDYLRPYCGTSDVRANRDNRPNSPSRHAQEGVVNLTRQAIGRHRVTVGTCGSLGVLYQMGFPRGHFTHVVIDEAGQATEPEILIPLVFLHKSYGQAILAGDPLQLGPVVLSPVASHFGLGESFLSRLLLRSPYCRDPVGFPDSCGYNPHLVTRLIYNYRSLPEILQLPNNMFYHGDLVPQVSPEDSEEAAVLSKLIELLPSREGNTPPALVFHGVRGTNCQSQDSPSWYNPHEAVQATLHLQSLYNAGLSPDQCGIITPYQAQVLKIRQILETLEVEVPKVGSVEEFQGQERMVIILSTVRSSPRLVETDIRHCVGFVASPRRLNVAITRARACLIVLGNPHLLARDHYWRTVLQYCVGNGGYTGCDLPLDL